MKEHGSHTYTGNYSRYLEVKEDIKVKNTSQNSEYIERKKSLSEIKKIKNQIQRVEKEISSVEKEIEECQARLLEEDVINSYKKYNEITDTIDSLNIKLEELLEQWESLQDE